MKKKINVYTEITPNPDVMKFVTSELITKHDIEISKSKNNKKYPIANELLIFPFVEEIYISKNFLAIKKNNNVDWLDISNEMREFIQDYINNNETIIETPPKVNNKKYDDKEKQINEILENEVLPAVRMDGGNIIIIEFKNGVLKLGMKGACNGCPSASITLKEGIHATLEKYLPGEIKKITSVNV